VAQYRDCRIRLNTAYGRQSVSPRPQPQPLQRLTMPGPANARRKRKNRNNKASNKAKTTAPAKAVDSEQTKPALQHDDSSSSPSSPSPGVLRTPSPSFFELLTREKPYVMEEGALQVVEEKMCQEPFIYDPGNGPRVRDARMFMTSFFAQPPSIDVRPVQISICCADDQ